MEGCEIKEMVVEVKMEEEENGWDQNYYNQSLSEVNNCENMDEGLSLDDKDSEHKSSYVGSLPIRKSARLRKKTIKSEVENDDLSADEKCSQVLESTKICSLNAIVKSKGKQTKSVSPDYSSDSRTDSDDDSQTSDFGSCTSASPPPSTIKLRRKKDSVKTKRTVRKFVCVTCKKSFSTSIRLQNHTEKWHNPNYVNGRCTLCDKKIDNETCFFFHYQRLHGSKDKKKSSCHICGISIDSFRMEKHLKFKHGNSWLLCQYCPRSFKSESGLRSHCITVHSDQVKLNIPANSISTSHCSRCTSKFDDHNGLKAHVENVHPNNYFPCHFCKAFRYNQMTFQLHTSLCTYGNKLTKRQVLKEFDENESVRNYKLPCELCGKLVKLHNFEKHTREVHEVSEDKKLSCFHCHKQFQIRLYLADHADFVHGVEVDKLPEGWCKLSLKDRSDEVIQGLKDKWKGLLTTELDEGTRSRHYIKGRKRPITYVKEDTREKKKVKSKVTQCQIVCDICDTLISSGHFSRHMSAHGITQVSNDPSSLLCSQCPRRFPKLWLLKKHCLKVHNEKVELKNGAHTYLPSNCSRCPLKFDDYSKLKSHVQSVHPNNYFLCQFCDSFRYSKMAIKFHYKVCKRATTLEQTEAYKNCDTQDLSSYRIPCELCGKLVALQNFTTHLKRIHGLIEDQKLNCEHCPKQFHSRLYLADHMDLAHGVEVNQLPEGWANISLKNRSDVVIETLKQRVKPRQDPWGAKETPQQREKRLIRSAKSRLKRKLLLDNVTPEEIERQLDNLGKTYKPVRSAYKSYASANGSSKLKQLQATGMTRSQAKLALESPEERKKRLNNLRLSCKKIKLKAQLVQKGVSPEEIEKQLAELVKTFVPVKSKSAGYKPKKPQSSHFKTVVESIESNLPTGRDVNGDADRSNPLQTHETADVSLQLLIVNHPEAENHCTVTTSRISPLPPPNVGHEVVLVLALPQPEEGYSSAPFTEDGCSPSHASRDSINEINHMLLITPPPISLILELHTEPSISPPPPLPPTQEPSTSSDSNSTPFSLQQPNDGTFENGQMSEIEGTLKTTDANTLREEEICDEQRENSLTSITQHSIVQSPQIYDNKLNTNATKSVEQNKRLVISVNRLPDLENAARAKPTRNTNTKTDPSVHTRGSCHICGAKIASVNLSSHILSHCAKDDIKTVSTRLHQIPNEVTAKKKSIAPTFPNCSRCSTEFSSLVNLKSHVETAHPDQYFPCPFCSAFRYNKMSLKNHLKLFCGSGVKGAEKQAAIKTLGDGPHLGNYKIPCGLCGTSITLLCFKTHLKKVHGVVEDSWKCFWCHREFSNRLGFADHADFMHGIEVDKLSKEWTRLNLKGDAIPHERQRRHRGATKCDLSSQQSKKQPFEKVAKTRHTICHICGVSINSVRMKKHLEFKHGDNWLLCSHCPSRFKSESGLRSHCLKAHFENFTLKRSGNFVSTSHCSRCSSKFDSHDELKAHVESVHSKNYFPCRFCSAFRYNQKTFQLHIRACGNGNSLAKKEALKEFGESESIRNYQMPCELCEKMVKLHNFEKHFREVHEVTEDKKLTCFHCPKQFQMRLYLADHVDFVHGVEVDKLPEGWCNLGLEDRSDEVIQRIKDKWKGLLTTEMEEGTRSRKYIKGRKRPINFVRKGKGGEKNQKEIKPVN